MMAHIILPVSVEVNSCIIPYYLLANCGVAIILHCGIITNLEFSSNYSPFSGDSISYYSQYILPGIEIWIHNIQ